MKIGRMFAKRRTVLDSTPNIRLSRVTKRTRENRKRVDKGKGLPRVIRSFRMSDELLASGFVVDLESGEVKHDGVKPTEERDPKRGQYPRNRGFEEWGELRPITDRHPEFARALGYEVPKKRKGGGKRKNAVQGFTIELEL
jgi:hypothetical protein